MCSLKPAFEVGPAGHGGKPRTAGSPRLGSDFWSAQEHKEPSAGKTALGRLEVLRLVWGRLEVSLWFEGFLNTVLRRERWGWEQARALLALPWVVRRRAPPPSPAPRQVPAGEGKFSRSKSKNEKKSCD